MKLLVRSLLIGVVCSVAGGSSAQTPAPKNIGTQVWMVAPPAGDMLKLADLELWATARRRIDVISFGHANTYDHPGHECGISCGPNTFPALRDVVPGGLFKLLQDQGILLGIEAGGVKEYSCTAELVREKMVSSVVVALDNVASTGAKITYLTMDEPFAAGSVPPAFTTLGYCGLSAQQVAQLVKVFVDGVHERHPEVQIGLIEPYPFFSADRTISNLLELEHAGVQIAYFHLDMYRQAVVNQREDTPTGLRRIHEFCRSRNIPFGVNIFGEDGSSNEKYTRTAWAALRLVMSSVGVTELTTFESWAEDPPGDMNGRRHIPDTVPDSSEVSFTGQILRMLQYMAVKPTS